MDLDQLVNELSKHHREIQGILKLLKDTRRLDSKRTENLSKLEKQLSKLKEIVDSNLEGEFQDYVRKLREWSSQYEEVLQIAASNIKKRLGHELEEQVKSLGLSLSGQYPELKAGFFTIELNFSKQVATLWYGPKQEQIAKCPLTAMAIAEQIRRAKDGLGSGLKEKELLEKIQNAYRRVMSKEGEPAPIIHVLSELAYLLQTQRFHQDPRKENYKSYSRADFSYDLYRIRKYQSIIQSPVKLHLKVATRRHTRHRTGFLWVPDKESGKGTAYSHLTVREE